MDVAAPVAVQIEADAQLDEGAPGNSLMHEYRPRWAPRALRYTPAADETAPPLEVTTRQSARVGCTGHKYDGWPAAAAHLPLPRLACHAGRAGADAVSQHQPGAVDRGRARRDARSQCALGRDAAATRGRVG
ncbi:MAG: hypothetical protein R2854_20955 [Caldilineaceae bacterium]